ncbi:hypothetical protein SAMN06298216_2173 [Spirosomataceae bacterium TFI 002]|nr:hypothetical protein SAMN06298216_2173 [Spirosomataceae bacterium TFI 002]
MKEPPIGVNISIDTLVDGTIEAGKDFAVAVPKGKHVSVVTSWGSYFLPIISNSEESHVVIIPSSINRQAGRMTIKFFDGTPDCEIEIKPGLAVEPLETYVGEKSIVADGGEDWAMLTVIPQDEFFNLTKSGTGVDFKMVRPNGKLYAQSISTNYGVAFSKIFSERKVGKTIIAVNTNGIAAKEKELLEIAGPPVDFKIEAIGIYPYADSRQYFQMESSEILDRFGNQVANGTLVQFSVSDANGSSRILNAYTISGKAILNINNPSNEGRLQVQASIGDYAKSNIVGYDFRRHIQKMDANFEGKYIVVGPVIGRFGQYATDGTEVVLEDLETGFTLTKYVKKGYARFSTEGMNTKSYALQITCGGFVKTLKSENNE